MLGFTTEIDQSESRTQACHARISNILSLLSASSTEARASRVHFFFVFIFLCLWTFMHCGIMSIFLFTEVNWQWAKLVLGWVTAAEHCSCLK